MYSKEHRLFGELAKLGDGSGRVNVFNYVFLVKCLMYYILLWKIKLVNIQNHYAILLLKIQCISLVTLVFFSQTGALAYRVSEVFGIVEIITIPMLIYLFQPKFIIRLGVLFIAFIMFSINLFYSNLIG